MGPKLVFQPEWAAILDQCAAKIVRPECTKLYTLETIDEHVSADEVQKEVECYNYVKDSGRSEYYYILVAEGKRVAVRGITNARFVYFHYYKADIAEQHRVSFDESYFARPGEWEASGACKALCCFQACM
jgi:hypothetical protein